MKITNFETFQLKAPLDIPFGWSQDTITSRSVGLVKITTDEGVLSPLAIGEIGFVVRY